MTGSSHAGSRQRTAHEAPNWVFWMLLVWVVLVLVLGGASQNAIVRDMVIRVASSGMIGWIGWHLLARSPSLRARFLLALAGFGLLMIGWQLVPLPESVTGALPGRGQFLSDLQPLGVTSHFSSASIAPLLTWDALLGVLPWAVGIGAALLCSHVQIRALIMAILVVAGVSVCLLAFQTVLQDRAFAIFQSVDGRRITGTGFFVNRNHFAAFMAVCIPLAAWWTATLPKDTNQDSKQKSRIIQFAVITSASVLGTVGVAVSDSRAGLLLWVIAMAGTGLVLLLGTKGKRRLWYAAGAGLLVLAGVAVIAISENWGGLTRLLDAHTDVTRLAIWNDVSKAVALYWPAGSGGETIVPVMLVHEAIGNIDGTFINRAHNEYLGILLEHGLAGLIWMIAAFGLLVGAVVGNLLAAFRSASAEKKSLHIRSQALILLPVVLLLAHSAIDFPIRTPALGFLFALLVALTILGRTSGADVTAPSRHGAGRPV
jgi:O-antigen ligase